MRRRIISARAFTLVELLVVLAIIVVLVSLLLPLLIGAKRQAQQIKCASHLKQIGVALTVYTQDYKYFPEAGLVPTDNSYATAHCWPVRLRKMLSGNKNVFYCPAQDPKCNWTRDATGHVAWAQAMHTNFGYEMSERLLIGSSASSSGMWFSYGYNNFGANWRQSPSDPISKGMGAVSYENLDSPPWKVTDVNLRKASAVKAASNFITIADTTADSGNDFGIVPQVAGVAGARMTIGDVHRGGANVLFLDGHVQWHMQSDLTIQWPPVPDEAKKQRMWNWDNQPAGPW